MRALLVVCVLAALAAANVSAMGVDRVDAEADAEADMDLDAFVAVEDEVFDTRVFAHGAVAADAEADVAEGDGPERGDTAGTGYDEATAKKAADYSSAAYYKGKPQHALDWKGNHQEKNFRNAKTFRAEVGTGKDATEVSAYAGYDKKENKIVVAYRGTGSAHGGDGKQNGGGGSKQLKEEVKHGFTGHTTGPNGAKTTDYFGQATDAVHNAGLQQHVEKLRAKHPNADVLVTGHSLGGAMAQNGAMKMHQAGVFNAKENPKAGKDAIKQVDPHVYTFGQPKTGNKEMNKQYNAAIPNHFRVQHAQDLVPKTGAWTGGSNAGHKVRYDAGMADGQFKVTPQGSKASSSGNLPGAIGKSIGKDASKAISGAKPTSLNPIKALGKGMVGAGKLLASPVTGMGKALKNGGKQHSDYFGPMGSQFKNYDQQIKAHAAGLKDGTQPQGFKKGQTLPDPKPPKPQKPQKPQKPASQKPKPQGLPHAPEATGIGRKGQPGKPRAGAGAKPRGGAGAKPKPPTKKPAPKPKATKTPRTPPRKPATRPRRF